VLRAPGRVFPPRPVVFKPMIKCSGRNRYFLTTLSKVTRGKSACQDICHVGDYPYSSPGNKIFLISSGFIFRDIINFI